MRTIESEVGVGVGVVAGDSWAAKLADGLPLGVVEQKDFFNLWHTSLKGTPIGYDSVDAVIEAVLKKKVCFGILPECEQTTKAVGEYGRIEFSQIRNGAGSGEKRYVRIEPARCLGRGYNKWA